MSRDDGFTVMDVSTDISGDPKVRKLWRHAPDHAGSAFLAYVATMAESWKAGRRVSIDDAWPAFVPFDRPAVEALVHVGLLDHRGMVNVKAWHGWFDPANKRRDIARAKWKRANDKRRGDADDTPESPRGDNAVTPAPVPSAPPVPPAPLDSQGVSPLAEGRDNGSRPFAVVNPGRTA